MVWWKCELRWMNINVKCNSYLLVIICLYLRIIHYNLYMLIIYLPLLIVLVRFKCKRGLGSPNLVICYKQWRIISFSFLSSLYNNTWLERSSLTSTRPWPQIKIGYSSTKTCRPTNTGSYKYTGLSGSEQPNVNFLVPLKHMRFTRDVLW